MVVMLGIGLLGTFALGFALCLAFFAWDEEPQEQNLRALRERAEAAAATHADREAPAYGGLKAAA